VAGRTTIPHRKRSEKRRNRTENDRAAKEGHLESPSANEKRKKEAAREKRGGGKRNRVFLKRRKVNHTKNIKNIKL